LLSAAPAAGAAPGLLLRLRLIRLGLGVAVRGDRLGLRRGLAERRLGNVDLGRRGSAVLSRALLHGSALGRRRRLLLAAAPTSRAAPRLLLRLCLFWRSLLGSRLRLGLAGLLPGLLRLRSLARGRLPSRLFRLALRSDRLGRRVRLRDERRVGGSVDEPLDAHLDALADHGGCIADADRVAVARAHRRLDIVLADLDELHLELGAFRDRRVALQLLERALPENLEEVVRDALARLENEAAPRMCLDVHQSARARPDEDARDVVVDRDLESLVT